MLVYLIWGLYLGQTLLFEARNFEFCSNFHASRYTILLRKLSKHYPIFGKLYLRWPDQFWQHDIGTSTSHTFFKGRMLACHYNIVHSEKENSAPINSCRTVCRFTYYLKGWKSIYSCDKNFLLHPGFLQDCSLRNLSPLSAYT